MMEKLETDVMIETVIKLFYLNAIKKYAIMKNVDLDTKKIQQPVNIFKFGRHLKMLTNLFFFFVYIQIIYHNHLNIVLLVE